MIEQLRRTNIRLDREGRFWHQGGEITHPGLKRALLRWMDRLDDGRPVLRLDEQRYAYVEVEGTPLLVVAARWDGDRAFVTSNDGSEEELGYSSLSADSDNALYCRVRHGRLEARVSTSAYYVLAENIVPLDPQETGFVLRARGQTFPIAPRLTQ